MGQNQGTLPNAPWIPQNPLSARQLQQKIKEFEKTMRSVEKKLLQAQNSGDYETEARYQKYLNGLEKQWMALRGGNFDPAPNPFEGAVGKGVMFALPLQKLQGGGVGPALPPPPPPPPEEEYVEWKGKRYKVQTMIVFPEDEFKLLSHWDPGLIGHILLLNLAHILRGQEEDRYYQYPSYTPKSLLVDGSEAEPPYDPVSAVFGDEKGNFGQQGDGANSSKVLEEVSLELESLRYSPNHCLYIQYIKTDKHLCKLLHYEKVDRGSSIGSMMLGIEEAEERIEEKKKKEEEEKKKLIKEIAKQAFLESLMKKIDLPDVDLEALLEVMTERYPETLESIYNLSGEHSGYIKAEIFNKILNGETPESVFKEYLEDKFTGK
jgi:hypothetical protein